MSHFVPRVQCEITIITDDIISKLCQQNVEKNPKIYNTFHQRLLSISVTELMRKKKQV